MCDQLYRMSPRRGYSLTFNTGGSVPMFGVRKFTLNQYLGFVNYNMDTNSISVVHKSDDKEESWNLSCIGFTWNAV